MEETSIGLKLRTTNCYEILSCFSYRYTFYDVGDAECTLPFKTQEKPFEYFSGITVLLRRIYCKLK